MLPVTGFPLAAYVAGAAALALCADVKLALRRCNVDIKEAAALVKSRTPKLSEQLNAQQPFTLWCRFSDLGDRTVVFWREFNAIRAQRFGQEVVSADLGRLIDTVDGLHKRMAKMPLPYEQQEREHA